ncbi:MAG: aminotransferase class I/II-fold pyridoxal phosphate-dependent enzyme [Candidatus Lambdaproteobacteria bacterium]|nr:aminotransferase class I/II-fold pyridoxal phosphate-dependent enzyme [Candidatus Lambdaproteobacteria bacterium]
MRFRRTSRIQLSPIKEVELAAARRADVVSLAQGIPSFDTPEVIKSYVKQKLDEGYAAKYSLAPGMLELRESVAEHLLRDGMRYDPGGEILITAGSIEGIAATLIAATEPGDEVILPSPCYASYQQVIRMAGAHPRFVALDEERNFDLDVEAIARAITPRTAAIFYCNPNNPSGTIYSRAQSLRLLELAERHDLLILCDEAYRDMLYTDEPYFSPAQVEAYRQRVVRIFTFSKAYAMTGWRVAYLHSERRVVAEILKVHDSLVTCAPVISQHAAFAALELAQGAVAEFTRIYRRRRDLMLRHLDALSHVFDYQKPAGAYFVFPRVKDPVPLAHDSRRLAFDLIEQAGVALVPGSAFGPTGERHLRMSFGRSEEDIDEAFRRMRLYFNARMGLAAVGPLPAPVAPSLIKPGPVAGRPQRLEPPEAAPAPPPPPAPASGPTSGSPWRHAARAAATAYLSALARLYLWRRRLAVVAIAGSGGKTVVKRTLVRLLERHGPVRANPRSYNTEIGLPLAVLGLEIDTRRPGQVLRTLLAATWRAAFDRAPLERLVLELGVRRAGEMAVLLRTVRPDWAIVTQLAAEPEADPAELDALAREMAALARVLPVGRLLVCADDPRLDALARPGAPPDLRLSRNRLEPAPGGWRFAGAQGAYRVGEDVVGDSALYAIQAAVLLGERLGLEPAAIQAFLDVESGVGKAAGGGSPTAAPPATFDRSA